MQILELYEATSTSTSTRSTRLEHHIAKFRSSQKDGRDEILDFVYKGQDIEAALEKNLKQIMDK